MNVTDRALLLDGVIEFLEKQLLPSLSGEHRFVTRVAVNALGMIQRELRAADAPDPELAQARERIAARLPQALASDTGIAADERVEGADAEGARDDTDAFERRLAGAIRGGALACEDPMLLDYIRASLRHTLQINNPKWLAPPKNPR